MIHEYIQAALELAHYEMIEDEEPYYGEIAALQGIWATGRTLEECRRNLTETIEGWVLVRIRNNLDIPEIKGFSVNPVSELKVA
ncbi:MAG: type II toxin-antitoxin system HicB family antitoxin [Proteobacteria bacterium]|nr:type II toxin-antitoxin system HicB family antitoxin [Pseudomonadota bacterium]